MQDDTPPSIITLRDSTVFDADNAQLITHQGEHAPGHMSLSQRTVIRQHDEDAWDVIGRRYAGNEDEATFWQRIKAANPPGHFDEL